MLTEMLWDEGQVPLYLLIHFDFSQSGLLEVDVQKWWEVGVER